MMKAYYDLMSQPSRAVYLLLRANSIKYTDCPVAIRKGEHLTPEYASINPFQKVPALDDNGFKLTESVAILKYLCDSQSSIPEHWYPKDLKARARVDEYMAWQHSNLRFYGSMYFRTVVLGNKPVDEKKLETWRVGLEKSLSQIEEIFLKSSPYVNGSSEITIADLLAICELEQPIMAGYNVCEGRATIKAYMDRVQKQLAPHYEAAHKHCRQVASNVAKAKL